MMNNHTLSTKEVLVVTIVCSLTIFMLVLDLTIANVCLPYISGDLASTPSQAVHVITSFSIGVAISISIAGYLSQNFGQYKSFLISLTLFILFSFLCGISTSMEELIFFRFLQGCSSGPMIPIGQSYLVQINPKNRIQTVLAIFSMVVLVAPVLGPIIGGYFCIYHTWHWAFLVNIPAGVFCLFVLGILLKKVPVKINATPLDRVSFIFLFIGVIALQIMLSKGQQWNWFLSFRTSTLFCLSFVAFGYFILWNFHYKKSLFNFKLFKLPTYALSILLLCFTYGPYMGLVVIIPFWLQTQMGYTALSAGLAVAPLGFFPVILGFVISRFLAKGYHLHLILLSTVFLFLANLYVMNFTPQVDFSHIFISRMLYGLAVAFWISPLFSLTVMDVKNEELPRAMSMFHFCRSLIVGVSSALVTTLYTRRMILHHSDMVEKINIFNPEVMSYFASISFQGLSSAQAKVIVETEIVKQASVLSLIDICYVMNWMAVVVVFSVVLLWKKCNIRYTTLKKAAEYEHH